MEHSQQQSEELDKYKTAYIKLESELKEFGAKLITKDTLILDNYKEVERLKADLKELEQDLSIKEEEMTVLKHELIKVT